MCREMAQSEHLNSSNVVGSLNIVNSDRISALPMSNLHHILGFLTTKCAVATSILSKKWRYAWVYVPTLNFTDLPSTISDGTFNQEQLICFKNFISRVLLLNGAPCLEHVCFEAYGGLQPANVFEWLLVISRRNMKELYLTNKVPSILGLDSKYILAKNELVVLKVERLFFKDFRCPVNLPRLRTLSLKDVGFPDEQDPFAIILPNCPSLEELNIECCIDVKKFCVKSSSLKTLRIVTHNKTKESVIIKTPNLKALHLSIGIKQSLVDDLPLLVDARLELWTSTVRWVNLLHKFRFIKSLVLDNTTLDGINVVNRLSTFGHLEVLQVSFSPWPFVLQILRNAPKLTTLSIKNLMFDWPDTVPKTKELPLEIIECHCVDELEDGYDMIQFFLSNSKALKEFKFHVRRCLDSELENEILKSLLIIPRASNQCRITVINGDEDTESEESESEPEDPMSD